MRLFSCTFAVLLAMCGAVVAELGPAVYERLRLRIERGQLAVIKDADGYVNLRGEPNSKSEPVLKIQKDEFFICEPSEAAWWPVSDFFGNEGFIHASRIRLLRDLPDADLDRLFVNPPTAPRDEPAQREQLYQRRHSTLEENQDHAVVADGLAIAGLDQLYSHSSGKQHLYLSYYTDGLLPAAMLFSSDPPDAVLERINVFREQNFETSEVSTDEKKRSWQRLVAASNKVPWLNFTTARGLRLGDQVEKAIGIFGAPHQQKKMGNLCIYEWGFPGRCYYDEQLLTGDVLDRGRSLDPAELRTKGERIILRPAEFARLRELLSRENGIVLRQLAINCLIGTRGSRAGDGYGFFVTAFVREGKIAALDYSEGAL